MSMDTLPEHAARLHPWGVNDLQSWNHMAPQALEGDEGPPRESLLVSWPDEVIALARANVLQSWLVPDCQPRASRL